MFQKIQEHWELREQPVQGSQRTNGIVAQLLGSCYQYKFPHLLNHSRDGALEFCVFKDCDSDAGLGDTQLYWSPHLTDKAERNEPTFPRTHRSPHSLPRDWNAVGEGCGEEPLVLSSTKGLRTRPSSPDFKTPHLSPVTIISIKGRLGLTRGKPTVHPASSTSLTTLGGQV